MRRIFAIAFAALAFILMIPQNANAATIQYKAYTVAKAQIGDKYLWGATGPSKFDCSGLVQYSFKKAGKSLPHYTGSQFNKTKNIVSAQKKPGDLIFFSHKGTRDRFHVGIYAGGGYMVHANAGGYYGKKVIKEKISSYWSKKYSGDYRRVK